MIEKPRSPRSVRIALVLWLAGLSVGIVAGAGVALHLNAARGAVLGGG